MSLESIEKLREFGRSTHLMSGDRRVRDVAYGLADAIEQEIAERYVKLPVDADGETWHIGDEIQAPPDGHATVKGLRVYELGGEQRWEVISGSYLWGASTHRHYHAPTVEAVLCQFIDAIDDDRYGQAEIIAEYAAKIREMMGE